MSNLDELLANAAAHQASFQDRVDVVSLSMSPRKGVTVITCVDPRVDPMAIFGFATGDAIIIRVPGGRVTKEMIDEVLVAGIVAKHRAFGARPVTNFLVVHHTQCAIASLADDAIRAQVAGEMHGDPSHLERLAIHSFEESLATDVELLREDPRLSTDAEVSGYVYDVETGQLTQVIAPQ